MASPRRSGLGERARAHQPAGRAGERRSALQPRRSDREGDATTTKVVLTVPDGFSIDSFVAAPGWKRDVQPDRLRREHGRPEGDLDRRSRKRRSARGGRVLPVPRRGELGEDVHVRGRADLLRRLGRRLDGARELRHAGADGRGEVVARRRRQLDARRSSRSSSAPSASSSAASRSSRAAGSGRSREPAGAGCSGRARRCGGGPDAAPGGVGARVPRQDGAVGERRREQSAPERLAHLRRGGRAALRHRSRSPTPPATRSRRARCTGRRATRTRWSCR